MITVTPASGGARQPFEDEIDHQRRQTERCLVGDEQLREGGQRQRHRQHLLLASRQEPGPLSTPLGQNREDLEGPVHRLAARSTTADGGGGHAEVVGHVETSEDAPALGEMDHAGPADAVGGLGTGDLFAGEGR